MGTKIAAHTDMELIQWILRLDEAIDTVRDAEAAFGMLTHETASQIRRIQREIQEEIGHRAVIGTWVGHAPST